MIKQFDNLTIEDQVDFINNELQKDKKISVTKLCKNFGINKSTLISRFTQSGYKYNNEIRAYIEKKTIDTKVIQDAISYKDIESVDNINKIDTDIKELIENKEAILSMLKEYQNNINNISKLDKEMIIDVGLVGGKTVNHNFKIYESTKKEIQELQSQYPHFRLTDLVSTALHMYYLKYKK